MTVSNCKSDMTVIEFNQIDASGETIRQVDSCHVENLAQSIKKIGLLQPLVINTSNELLAGRHRHAAILRIKDENPLQFKKLFPEGLIPVRIMQIDSSDKEDAFNIEMAENEIRRDHTDREIMALILKLKKMGYSTSRGGHAGKSHKHITVALSKLICKSTRQARRILNCLDSEGTYKKLQQKKRITASMMREERDAALEEKENLRSEINTLQKENKALRTSLKQALELIRQNNVLIRQDRHAM